MREAVKTGVITGIVTIFFAAVGLIGNFTDLNLIEEVVTFALLMILPPPVVAGYVIAAPGRGGSGGRAIAGRGRADRRGDGGDRGRLVPGRSSSSSTRSGSSASARCS